MFLLFYQRSYSSILLNFCQSILIQNSIRIFSHLATNNMSNLNSFQQQFRRPNVTSKLAYSVANATTIDQKLTLTRQALYSMKNKPHVGVCRAQPVYQSSPVNSRVTSNDTPQFYDSFDSGQQVSSQALKIAELVESECQTEDFFEPKCSEATAEETEFEKEKGLWQKKRTSKFARGRSCRMSDQYAEEDSSELSLSEGFKKITELADTNCTFSNTQNDDGVSCFFSGTGDKLRSLTERWHEEEEGELDRLKEKIEILEKRNKHWKNKAAFYKQKCEDLEASYLQFYESYQASIE